MYLALTIIGVATAKVAKTKRRNFMAESWIVSFVVWGGMSDASDADEAEREVAERDITT